MSVIPSQSDLPREAIRNTILEILNSTGSTITQIQKSRERQYPGDDSQHEYGNKSVWHTRRDILPSVAKALNISRTHWGPGRSSSDFYNVVDQEIAKIRSQGLVTDWNSSKRFGIWRASRSLNHLIRNLKPTLAGTVPTHVDDHTWDEGSTMDVMKREFITILTRGRKDNTYKFALARSLLEYCHENNDSSLQVHEIPYRYLSNKFLKYYWYQECKFRIKQDFRTKGVPKAVRAIRDVFGNDTTGDFDMLDRKDIEDAEAKILKTVFGHARSKTSLVVPRFQNVPKGVGSRHAGVFYEYSDDEQKIFLKPEAFRFFRKNYHILFRAVLAEWAKFLERINTSLPKLVAKIEQDEVKRGTLGKFRDMYVQHTNHCFYCANRLEQDFIHVDHFIPWSYIFDDNAWNLVLACRDCNLKKSNSLPQGEFRDELIRRNAGYSDRIKHLKRSLDLLDAGRGWEPEIKNHYKNCRDYGFSVIRLP